MTLIPRARTYATPLLARSLAVLVAVAGCRDIVQAPPPPEIPSRLRLHATAEGVAGGKNHICTVDWVLEIAPHASHHRGTGGGDAFRSVLDETGAGLVFWGEAFTYLRIDHGDGGSLTITGLDADGDPMPPVGDSRFWEELRVWAGVIGSGETVGVGTWTCAPMDAMGDDYGTILGNWTLTPLDG